MFLRLRMADGSIDFVNLAHVVHVHKVSDEQCVIYPVAGNFIIVNGRENVDRVIETIPKSAQPSPQP